RPPEGARHSAYFRHAFTTTEPFTGLLLHLARDDGAIVYLDGEEVARTNMPEGAEDAHALAAIAVLNGAVETVPASLPIARPLPAGRHVLAISLHNSSPTSSDLRLAEATLYGLQ
ncbi:MAG: hypothetical protein O3C21_03100, partial [Verrucomicrobia bacterium]|nr:hypothetical protein [Verrucomicrobiota bacterium]